MYMTERKPSEHPALLLQNPCDDKIQEYYFILSCSFNSLIRDDCMR